VDRLVAGLSNKAIAREFGISYRTVEVHRARIMDKTQARSFSELVRLALESMQSRGVLMRSG
jgi:two-component system response regulator FixJ